MVSFVKGGRIDVRNEAQFGHPSVITGDLKDRVEAHIHENTQFITNEPNEVFPYVSQSVLNKTVIVQL
jgi:hypothetical protein